MKKLKYEIIPILIVVLILAATPAFSYIYNIAGHVDLDDWIGVPQDVTIQVTNDTLTPSYSKTTTVLSDEDFLIAVDEPDDSYTIRAISWHWLGKQLPGIKTIPVGSIVINSDQPYTNNNLVSLTLTGLDYTNNSFVGGQMSLKNDDGTWGNWQNFASYVSDWPITSGTGVVRTVYVKFKDADGQESTVYSDAITLNPLPLPDPTLSPTSPYSSTSPFIHVHSYCSVSGVKMYYTISNVGPPTDPTQNDFLMDPESVIIINQTGATTVKVKAYKDGYYPSSIVTGTYTLTTGVQPIEKTHYLSTTTQYISSGSIRPILTKIGEPGVFRLEWTDPLNRSTSDYSVYRKIDNETPVLLNAVISKISGTNTYTCTDNYTFADGVKIEYSVIGSITGTIMPQNYVTGTPPPDDTWDWVYPTIYSESASDPITVYPKRYDASDNQAVDNRLDTRYIEAKLVDFNFKNLTYRGGLFVGFAANPDASKVGRSFIKFPIIPVTPTTNNMYPWTSTVNAYFTRTALSESSLNVNCHYVNDDTWIALDTQNPQNPLTLRWTNAPQIDTSAPYTSQTVSWNQNPTPTGSGWVSWDILPVLFKDIYEDEKYAEDNGILSVRLSSTNESQDSWAYFAKKEYDSTKAPSVLYAYGTEIDKAYIILDSYTVKGGNFVTGTVYMNGPAISITNVDIWTDCSDMVLSKATIPSGEVSGRFVISTAVRDVQKIMTIGVGRRLLYSVQLTITP